MKELIIIIVALIAVVGCTAPLSVEPLTPIEELVIELGEPDRIVDNPSQGTVMYTWYGEWPDGSTAYTVEIDDATGEIVGEVYHGEVAP